MRKVSSFALILEYVVCAICMHRTALSPHVYGTLIGFYRAYAVFDAPVTKNVDRGTKTGSKQRKIIGHGITPRMKAQNRKRRARAGGVPQDPCSHIFLKPGF